MQYGLLTLLSEPTWRNGRLVVHVKDGRVDSLCRIVPRRSGRPRSARRWRCWVPVGRWRFASRSVIRSHWVVVDGRVGDRGGHVEYGADGRHAQQTFAATRVDNEGLGHDLVLETLVVALAEQACTGCARRHRVAMACRMPISVSGQRRGTSRTVSLPSASLAWTASRMRRWHGSRRAPDTQTPAGRGALLIPTPCLGPFHLWLYFPEASSTFLVFHTSFSARFAGASPVAPLRLSGSTSSGASSFPFLPLRFSCCFLRFRRRPWSRPCPCSCGSRRAPRSCCSPSTGLLPPLFSQIGGCVTKPALWVIDAAVHLVIEK